MLHCNPMLQARSRLALNDVLLSAYLIRKAHRTHQLSILKAACYALAQPEQHHQRYQPLLADFDDFVVQQLSLRGTR